MRVTEKDLQAAVDRINQITGKDLKPYSKKEDGSFSPNPGVYHLDSAYGGWSLVQMMETGTGVRSIISGFRPKRELYDMIHAFISGLDTK
jgi:hypothetical protein